ncbi:MAG: dihydroneopterin aldolase [Gammaproteobacteria bacterium]|nr:dihydroneopterin aldolase [Gammaproteobacteria bacterium]
MDIIYLNDLRIDTVIGIYEWERRTKQTVIFDIEMAADIRKAAQSDNIDDTLSYKTVAKRLISYVSTSEFELIETLAEQVAGILLDEFKVPWCRLRLNKRGAVRGVRDVGIIIERGEKH